MAICGPSVMTRPSAYTLTSGTRPGISSAGTNPPSRIIRRTRPSPAAGDEDSPGADDDSSGAAPAPASVRAHAEMNIRAAVAAHRVRRTVMPGSTIVTRAGFRARPAFLRVPPYLTEPSDRPCTSLSWAAKPATSTGSDTTKAAAQSWARNRPWLVTKLVRNTGDVSATVAV